MVNPKECLFCRIVRGEIPAKKVYEDQNSLAFLDINPRNPGHTLIIPKKHFETLFDVPDGEGGKLFSAIKKVATMVKNGTKSHGVSVAQNNGSAAGQIVAHLYFHIIPRFLNEGPPALEAILPVKKMDDKDLNHIAASIKRGSQEPVLEPIEETIPDPKPARRERPKPPEEKHPKKEKKEEPEEDKDEFEELDMDF